MLLAQQGIPCKTSLLLERQTTVSDLPGPARLSARAAGQEELLSATTFGFTKAQEPFPEMESDAAGEQAGLKTRGGFACSSLSVVNWCF